MIYRKKKRRYPRKEDKYIKGLILMILILMIFKLLKVGSFKNKPKLDNENKYTIEQEEITSFEIPQEIIDIVYQNSKNNKKDISKSLASYVVLSYKGKEDKDIMGNLTNYKPRFFEKKKIKKMYKEAIECYSQFVLDIDTFPLSIEYEYSYENSWKSPRSYGGNRPHYGTDIMDNLNERGRIPILSMGSGVVENIGWNDMGGNRVGIRTANGAYIYYAHLSEYSQEIKEGSKVKAGDILGYMGDSGYGDEGTVGKFPVHLHIGIATDVFGSEQVWVNPYYFLKHLENKDTKILNSKGIF